MDITTGHIQTDIMVTVITTATTMVQCHLTEAARTETETLTMASREASALHLNLLKPLLPIVMASVVDLDTMAMEIKAIKDLGSIAWLATGTILADLYSPAEKDLFSAEEAGDTEFGILCMNKYTMQPCFSVNKIWKPLLSVVVQWELIWELYDYSHV